MRVLSLTEFGEFCMRNTPAWYIYSTQNQSDADKAALRFAMRFRSIIINMKPDRICFRNECDSLSIERVKKVVVYDEKPCVGTVFEVHSEGADGEVISTWLMD